MSQIFQIIILPFFIIDTSSVNLLACYLKGPTTYRPIRSICKLNVKKLENRDFVLCEAESKAEGDHHMMMMIEDEGHREDKKNTLTCSISDTILSTCQKQK